MPLNRLSRSLTRRRVTYSSYLIAAAAFGAAVLAPACGGAEVAAASLDPIGEGGGTGGTTAGGNGGSLVGGDAGSNGEGASSGTGGAVTLFCGDGKIQSPEKCDDKNKVDKDGCSKSCTVETGFACPTPGKACVKLFTCGDGKLSPGEECDDANTKSDDGCTNKCVVELGWECPTAGSRCSAIACGDGLIAGNEQCEDGDKPPASNDGCSDNCRLEAGFFCPDLGKACKKTACGNGIKEGDEPCDDGNKNVGDGCTPLCEREPTCVNGACESTCGDGMILAGDAEECDDGNTRDGDGCNKSCKKEAGYTCELQTEAPPDKLDIPVVYRDFVATGRALDGGVSHPDFNVFTGGGTKGLVKTTLKDGKPQFAGICDNDGPVTNPPCPDGKQLTTEANFNEWFRDGARALRVDSVMTLTRNVSGQYEFDSGASFFPLKNAGWVAMGKESANANTNFSFTTELRYWFELGGGETLDFSGDDDVWVFINNQLLIDLGGLHSEKPDSVTLTDEVIANLGMTKGRIYEVVLFQAERRETQSNFRLTLNGFVKTKSKCVATCGDGIVAGEEVCDDGKENGGYGRCKVDCSGLGPHCGDAVLQADKGEKCDDGTNLESYAFDGTVGCGPSCTPSARCGDKKVDAVFGEQCDDGNLKDGDGCESNCTFRTKCGDKKLDANDGETCDDGNRLPGDGCSPFCTIEEPIIR